MIRCGVDRSVLLLLLHLLTVAPLLLRFRFAVLLDRPDIANCERAEEDDDDDDYGVAR